MISHWRSGRTAHTWMRIWDKYSVSDSKASVCVCVSAQRNRISELPAGERMHSLKAHLIFILIFVSQTTTFCLPRLTAHSALLRPLHVTVINSRGSCASYMFVTPHGRRLNAQKGNAFGDKVRARLAARATSPRPTTVRIYGAIM